MKKISVLLLFVICFSCEKNTLEDDNYWNVYNSPLTHAELEFELDEPEIILNDLAKGELDRNVNSVLRQMFDNYPNPAEKYWKFEYLDNSDRVSKMIFYLPHYACEKETFSFYYNQENLIDSVISKRVNLCQEFEVLKVYVFNYNEKGLLKSIYMDNESFVEENYFGYYPNGKIKEIYNDYRGRGRGPNFGVQKFIYDSTFENIIQVDNIRPPNYHYTYQYFYDSNENPYKNFFIAVSVFMPKIGPNYLSRNNVIKIIEKNQPNGHEFTFEYLFNFSETGNLETYSDMDESKNPYVLYRVNP